jgi:hypothetical protein
LRPRRWFSCSASTRREYLMSRCWKRPT